MPIKASAGAQVQRLVADLASDSEITREAAVARLTVIGARAVERLTALAGSPAGAGARAAALRALDAIGDLRALDVILQAIEEHDATLAGAAIAAARGYLRGPRGPQALDRLTAVALDRQRPDAVRVAAVRAISDLDPATIAPLLARLKDDAAGAVRAAALPVLPARAVAASTVLAAAADGALPDDPIALRQAIVEAGASAPLAQLLRLVERLREREAGERAARRPEWATTRAAAHAALANRDSRLALYDLRESLEGAKAPLPVEFLTALERVGDASCLEAMASAYARARDEWWRRHLGDAFRTILKRERITRRHAVMKRIGKRWPAVLSSS